MAKIILGHPQKGGKRRQMGDIGPPIRPPFSIPNGPSAHRLPKPLHLPKGLTPP